MSEKNPQHPVNGPQLGPGLAYFVFGLLVVVAGLGVEFLLRPGLASDGLMEASSGGSLILRWSAVIFVGAGGLISLAVVMAWLTGPQTVRRYYSDETGHDAR